VPPEPLLLQWARSAARYRRQPTTMMTTLDTEARPPPVNSYQLGEVFNGFPDFPSDPPRLRGAWFYNDNYAPDLLTSTGLAKLGNAGMGPIVTRGVIIDIVGMK